MKNLFNGIYEYSTESSIIELSNTMLTQMSTTEKAVCLLRIFQDKATTIVIVTELATNPGKSVTNAAEVLATRIVKQFKLDPQTTRFIEHYGQESYEYEGARKRVDDFDEVTFIWNESIAMNPQWKSINALEMEKYLKKSKQKSSN